MIGEVREGVAFTPSPYPLHEGRGNEQSASLFLAMKSSLNLVPKLHLGTPMNAKLSLAG